MYHVKGSCTFRKTEWQGLFKRLSPVPVIDSGNLKFLYFSYSLVIGTFKTIFKCKNIGNKSRSYFSEGFFWLSLSTLPS